MTSRKIVIAVCTPFTVVSRSSLMSLIITFMFEPAKLQMNWASASGRIRRRADASGRPGVDASLAATGLSVTWLRPFRHEGNPDAVDLGKPVLIPGDIHFRIVPPGLSHQRAPP